MVDMPTQQYGDYVLVSLRVQMKRVEFDLALAAVINQIRGQPKRLSSNASTKESCDEIIFQSHDGSTRRDKIMQQLDLARMIAGVMGMPDVPAVGWLVHSFIGVVIYGAVLALLDERLPGDSRVWHSVLIAIVGWLLMMLLLMPMAGAGLFGLGLGIWAPVMTLMLHLIFGAVLGAYYGHSLARVPANRTRT